MYVNCRRNYDLTCWLQINRLCLTGLFVRKMALDSLCHGPTFGSPAAHREDLQRDRRTARGCLGVSDYMKIF